MSHMKEELGDVLLQVVFHSEIAEESGHFSFDDVAREVSDKLVRRHPHVYAQVESSVGDTAGVLAQWDAIKKGYESLSLPRRPVDAFHDGPGQVDIAARLAAPGTERPAQALDAGTNNRAAGMMQDLILGSSPDLGMKRVDNIGMTPLELGIGPGPDWLAEQDARMAGMEGMGTDKAVERAILNMALKRKRQQYSDEFNTPQAAADRRQLQREWNNR